MNDKLKLVPNGIFPIIYDKFGERIVQQTDTGFDIPGTIQGEGKLVGTPALFIRLSGCNLRCIWNLPNQNEFSICDTPYSSFHTDEFEIWNITDLISVIKHNSKNIKHLVITGGEPMLQHKTLTKLCAELKSNKDLFHITLETNGTLFNEDLAKYIDLVSLSPKLESSNPNQEKLDKLGLKKDSGKFDTHANNRINISVLQNFIDLKNSNPQKHDIQLKFVINKEEEIQEIKDEFLKNLNGWNTKDIFLMPTGINKKELETNSKNVLKLAIEEGWNYANRLHIDLFGDKAGV